MAVRAVKFVLKSAIAGSLIYVTLRVTDSPWIAPRHFARYTESKGNMAASFPVDSPEVTSPAEMLKETWNKGVKKVFNGLHEAPGTFKELSLKTMIQVKESYKNASK